MRSIAMQARHFTEEQEIFRSAYRQFLQKEVLPHRKAWRSFNCGDV